MFVPIHYWCKAHLIIFTCKLNMRFFGCDQNTIYLSWHSDFIKSFIANWTLFFIGIVKCYRYCCLGNTSLTSFVYQLLKIASSHLKRSMWKTLSIGNCAKWADDVYGFYVFQSSLLRQHNFATPASHLGCRTSYHVPLSSWIKPCHNAELKPSSPHIPQNQREINFVLVL